MKGRSETHWCGLDAAPATARRHADQTNSLSICRNRWCGREVCAGNRLQRVGQSRSCSGLAGRRPRAAAVHRALARPGLARSTYPLSSYIRSESSATLEMILGLWCTSTLAMPRSASALRAAYQARTPGSAALYEKGLETMPGAFTTTSCHRLLCAPAMQLTPGVGLFRAVPCGPVWFDRRNHQGCVRRPAGARRPPAIRVVR